MQKKELKIVDVTLRDGGLVNDFYFSDNFVKKLYEANLKAGTEIMEIGYKASEELFSTDKFGKWKFCHEEDIQNVLSEIVQKSLKISVMADVGRTNYRKDIIDKKDSIIDVIRVATYSKDMAEALNMIEFAKSKGYYVTCNIMAISTDTNEKIRKCLELLEKSSVDGIYVVDSYGALYPKEVQGLIELFKKYGGANKKDIGMHAHNNQQLAFANTIEAYENGANMLDASMCGMGRGAGNCMMEQLLAYLKDERRKIEPIFSFISIEMQKMKDNGIVWGYDTPYLITGMLNQHPKTAIEIMHNRNTDYEEYYRKIKGGDQL